MRKVLKTAALLAGMAGCILTTPAADGESISFTDSYKDSSVADGMGGYVVVSQDVGAFTAVLNVPGLGSLSANDFTNTVFNLSFGDVILNDSFANGTNVTATSSAFLQTWPDSNFNPVTVETITFSRSGNVLTINGSVNNNPLTTIPLSIIADQYYYRSAGLLSDQSVFRLSLTGALNYDLQKTVYLTGSVITNQSAQGDTLTSVTVSGAANFALPVLTFAAPVSNARLTNEIVTLQIGTLDRSTVKDVEISLNGAAYVPAAVAGTNLWSAYLDLLAGTNSVRAYALDSDNNFSLTNTLKIQYLVVNQLNLQLAGRGTISPNFSNAWLEIGRNYALTAAPGVGFVFTNWTSNLLPATNRSTVQFQMVSNLSLTANFVDIQKPVLAVTNLAAGQRVTNATFTVRGKATDNGQLGAVWVQLNGGDWASATPVDGWAGWSADLNLVPGTNQVAAYSVDTTGNISPTNRLNFQFVVPSLLNLQLAGRGTISPNFSNAWLEIGRNYALTAAPGVGFVFTNWTSNLLPATNRSTVQFQMVSNLSLTANFVDIQKPVLAVSLPAGGVLGSNAQFTVTGTAGDNDRVASVFYQLNGAEWTPAGTDNQFTNWTAAGLSLFAGTNTVSAYAVDATGNVSPTNRVKIIYVVRAPLVINIAGSGMATPYTNGQFLQIGNNYALTAAPLSGCLFSNWMGGPVVAAEQLGTSATLSFVMTSNLVLQANFVTNPFPAVAGNYQGLFYDPSNPGQANAGFFNATVTASGAFTAKLQSGANKPAFSGQLSVGGLWSTNNAGLGAGPVTAQFQLDLSGGDVLSGQFSGSSFSSQLVANRSRFGSGNPAPQAGKYTLVIPGMTNNASSPAGYGYGAVTVTTNGVITFAGRLGDGTNVTQGTTLSKAGLWPLYVPLYGDKGSVFGWLSFTNDTDRDLAGVVNWTKPGLAGAGWYTNGFVLAGTNALEVVGSRFNGSNGIPVLALTNGVLIAEQGNLDAVFNNGFSLGTNNVGTGPNALSLTFTNTSGLFSGSVTNPAVGRLLRVVGAVLQKQNAGYGQFPGTNGTGAVYLGK